VSLRHIREVVVASTDVRATARFHQSAFDLEVLEGTDSETEVLLGVAGSPGGRLRLVAAAGDAAAVGPPQVWDIGARLLGLYSHDLDRTQRAMAEAGGAPRHPVTYPYGTASLSELVGRGADGVWWTIPRAVPGAHRPSPAYAAEPDRLHSELHTAVLVTDDHDGAVAFFEAAGLTTAFDGAMSGSPFDELVGMPTGASLRLAFLVGPEQEAARLEIMSFTGVEAAHRTSDAVGIQRLVFVADDPAESHAALVAAGATPVADLVVRGPVGVEIEVVAR
jgi:hypothetical protein